MTLTALAVATLCLVTPERIALWGIDAPRVDRIDRVERLDRIERLDPAPAVVPTPLRVPTVTELLTTDPTVVAWAQQQMGGGSPRMRVRRLVQALLDHRNPGLRQVVTPTHTPQRAFELREANCVSFAALVVGLARAEGIPLVFARFEQPPLQHRSGELWVAEQHLVAAWLGDEQPRVYDFAGETSPDPRRVEPITDLTALALFQSNRGVEAFQASHTQQAAALLEQAVTLDPGLAEAWSNLGVVRRRLGDTAGARMAYERALLLDPGAVSAYRNLATLLHAEGRRHEASELLELAAVFSDGDAFEILALAQESLQVGELEAARGLFRHALTLSANP